MILMNETFKALITKLDLPTVPAAKTSGTLQGTFYDLVEKNYDFMFEGHVEGLVVVSPSSGPDVQVSQWKICAEANETNKGFLDKLLLEVETNGEQIFGENAARAKELF